MPSKTAVQEPTKHVVSKKGSAIETSSGTLHVQPYRPSKDSKQLLAKLTFVPRPSALESSGHDAFRGFYTLFWISVGIMMIRTYVTSFDQTGYPLSLSFAALFSKDALTLALSDAVLVASTGLSVPFVKLMVHGSIPYSLAVAIQHLYQGLMLGVAVKWTFDRRWEWVQSGFFTLHALVMLMKVHSYVSINGRFSQLFHKKQEQTKRLESLVNALPGGRSKAEIDARDARKLKQMETTAAMSTATSLGGDENLLKVPSGAATPSSVHSDATPSGTPKPIPNGIHPLEAHKLQRYP
ncbi:hypothetical protein M407DRAFT_34053 [Tulasnella calospora MUT 4182]|uniref:Uncharacterized protein n=1 Tax=Tulasnella calospora MUT 4182 TaxID=1051891 RepID=A0A0C3Q193_9AGAM|nr:hypothetical protein M407DRAFT_34053 [Tulasnella calospora MUT 4182]